MSRIALWISLWISCGKAGNHVEEKNATSKKGGVSIKYLHKHQRLMNPQKYIFGEAGKSR